MPDASVSNGSTCSDVCQSIVSFPSERRWKAVPFNLGSFMFLVLVAETAGRAASKTERFGGRGARPPSSRKPSGTRAQEEDTSAVNVWKGTDTSSDDGNSALGWRRGKKLIKTQWRMIMTARSADFWQSQIEQRNANARCPA